jgi:hypothetical protein
VKVNLNLNLKMLAHPAPQKFNTFNTFSTFAIFANFDPFSKRPGRPFPQVTLEAIRSSRK